MTQYQFGVGTIMGKRVDLATQPICFFGTCQEFSLSFEQEIVTLMGQNKVAVDAAPGELKIVGKIKAARVQASSFGSLLFGVAPTVNSGFDIIGPETHSAIPATTFTVSTTPSSYLQDLGVFYHNTGIALTPVTAAPTAGQYVAGVAATGVYTINTADESVVGGLDVYYQVSSATLLESDLNQQLMGVGPTLELDAAIPYTVGNTPKKFGIQVFAARISKMGWDFKNKAYLIPEMDFTCFANSAGQILRSATSE